MSQLKLGFVAVGPQRTATSWLAQVLRTHPEICLPQGVKETMFFEQYYDKGIDWYAAHFAHGRPGQVYGEVGPTYFDVPEIPARIQGINPACKIIVTLREPVSRTISLFHHHVAKGRVPGEFEAAVRRMPRIVESGHYARHVPRWIETFGAERVHYVLLDDIEQAPDEVLAGVTAFLGVEAIALPEEGTEKVGAAMMPRFPALAATAARAATFFRARRWHWIPEVGKVLGLKKVYTGAEHARPELTEQEQAQLHALYADDVAYVEAMLGRELPAWRQGG